MDNIAKNITILGLGFIGSSIARGLIDKYNITAFARKQDDVDYALNNKVIHQGFTDITKAVVNADIIIFCTPLATYTKLAQAIKPYIKPSTIITDVGSVKTSAMLDLAKVFECNPIVPAHPIAGSEQTGVKAGTAKLFKNKKAIICPYPKADSNATKVVIQLWQNLGSITEQMPAAKHDRIYAVVSHVPQLLSYAYNGALQHKRFAFTGSNDKQFNEFLRLAKSDTNMWSDIFLANKNNISEVLGVFFKYLKNITILNSGSKALTLDKNTKSAQATQIYPVLLGGAYKVTLKDYTKNYIMQSGLGSIHSSLSSLSNEQQTIDIKQYIATGYSSFTSFAEYRLPSETVAQNNEAIQLLSALLHRKIFEITVAMEGGDKKLLQQKLQEMQVN